LVVVALAACAGGDDDAETSEAAAQTDAPAGDAVVAGSDTQTEGPSDTTATAEDDVVALGQADAAGADLATLGRDLAIEIHVTMTTEDLRRTVRGIMGAAAAHGGAVFASDIDYGSATDDDDEAVAVSGRATLTVKLPPAELDGMLNGLDELGTVLSTNQQAQDVTDQLVDLAVRIRNAEQSVDRVRDFLAATTDLRQMVDLEAELTRRQTDLEQLLATQANLTERVAMSTLTIDVHPAAAPEPAGDGDADDDGIGDAFRAGWEAFVGVTFAVGLVFAVLAPFLVLAAIVLAIAWIVARPRRRRPTRATDVSDDADLAHANRPG
jgi:hypothetical protein